MPTTTSRAAYDTYTSEQFSTQNFGAKSIMKMSAGSGHRRFSYVYFGGIAPHGASVISATLRVWLRTTASWTSGPHTITVKRVNDTWFESRLTWDRSNADQLADSSPTATAAVTSGVDGQEVDIDVSTILSNVAGGTAWYGLRLEVNTGTDVQRNLYASESSSTDFRPQLSVVWSRPPSAPSNLAPGGGLSVSKSKPTLKWSFKDPDGDGQGSYQVQVSATSAVNSSGFTTTPEYDSGWISSGSSQHDLSTTAYAGLSNGATRFWIVRVQDVNGLISPWSSVQSFRRDTKGTLVISNPPDGGSVEETTPPITTTLTGRAQDSIAYTLEQVFVPGVFVGFDGGRIWSSGRMDASVADGTAFSFSIPSGKITKNGTSYKLTVWSYDAIDREATPGDPLYVAATSTFTFNRSAVPAPVTALTVTSAEPGVLLSFTRSTEPDFFALRVDGTIVDDRIDPTDLLVSGTSYAMLYYGATPNEPHTFEVEAVVTDSGKLKHSQSNTIVTYTPQVAQIWFVDAGDDQVYAHDAAPDAVKLSGQDSQSLAIGESSATFYPIGRRDPVRVVDSIRGLEGTISGTLLDDDASTMSIRLTRFKDPSRTGSVYRLIFGTLNIPVQLGTVSIAPLAMPTENAFTVQAEVGQVGDFQ